MATSQSQAQPQYDGWTGDLILAIMAGVVILAGYTLLSFTSFVYAAVLVLFALVAARVFFHDVFLPQRS